jgi:hypothetical protein
MANQNLQIRADRIVKNWDAPDSYNVFKTKRSKGISSQTHAFVTSFVFFAFAFSLAISRFSAVSFSSSNVQPAQATKQKGDEIYEMIAAYFMKHHETVFPGISDHWQLGHNMT